MVLKNIVYDFYSKDLSVKVRAAKWAKMRKGEAGGEHVPFGYVRSAADKKKYEIDPEVAKVERLLDAVAKYRSADELDNEMVLVFVEKVLIYDEEHVDIKWNFSDKLISVVMGK